MIKYLDEVIAAGLANEKLFVFSGGAGVSSSEFRLVVAKIAEQISRGVDRRSGLICVAAHSKTSSTVHCIFAVLSAGFGFLVFDPRWPEERIADILARSSPDAVIYCDRTPPVSGIPDTLVFRFSGARLICEEGRDQASIAQGRDENDLAYAIYTSGSTGRSKLVGISHRSIVEFLHGFHQRVSLSSDARWLSISSLSFDMSIVDLFYPASRGVTNTLIDGVFSVANLTQSIRDHEITHLSAVTSVIELLAHYIDRIDHQALKSLRAIHFGGERFDVSSARRLLKVLPGLQLIFGYGAAEACPASLINVFSSVPEEWDAVPVGTPIAGIRAGFADAVVEDAGTRGELVLGGPVLMTGYIGDPDRTKTVVREFAFAPTERVSKGYFTGDLFYRDREGMYWFRGRNDDLVKRSGFLVSLTQIEEAVKRLIVAEHVVAYLSDDKALFSEMVAIVVNADAVDRDLKSRLADIVPRYMIPDRIVFVGLDAIPRLGSGKIDRKKVFETSARASLTFVGG